MALFLLIAFTGCMAKASPKPQAINSEVVAEESAPLSTATTAPTEPPPPIETATTAPPTDSPPTDTPEPTSPPTNQPQATPWNAQSPTEPCQISETKHCAILYILADKYDDEHVLRTKPAFERNNYSTFVASNTLDEIRGFHECYDFTPAKPDLLLADVNVMDYDAIVFVGSDHDNTILHDDHEAHRIASEALAANRVVAAISDGPVILAKAGLLEGRTVNVIVNVHMHGVAEQWLHAIERAGATYTIRSPYRDGLLVTADIANVRVAYAILEVIDEIFQ
jgi:protease I